MGQDPRLHRSRRSACVLVLVLTLTTALAVGFGSISSAAPSRGLATGPSITPTQAKAIVQAWGKLLVATSSPDWQPSLLAKSEAPPLLDADQPKYELNKANGTPVDSPPYEVSDIEVFIPHQQSFPAQFLAQVTFSNGTQSSVPNYFVFVKPTKKAPWRTPFQVTPTQGRTQPTVTTDRKGYARRVEEADARKHLTADTAKIAAQYAKFFEDSVTSKAVVPSSTFSPIDVASYVDSSKSLPITFSAHPAGAPATSYRTDDGGALTVFALTIDEELTAPAGRTISSNTDILDFKANTMVHSYKFEEVVIIAMTNPKKAAGALAAPVAYYTGFVSVSSTPA